MALPPSKRREMGAFYLVFGPMELSAGLGYTTGQAYPDANGTLGVSLLRGDSCALHPGTRTHDSESDRRAPAPTATPGKAVCMVLPIKIHQNQGLCAECRLLSSVRTMA